MTPTTPQLFPVSRPYFARLCANSFTIPGQGFGDAQTGRVALDDSQCCDVVDSDRRSRSPFPPASPPGRTSCWSTAANGKSTVNGLTFHVLGSGYNPDVYEVGPGRTYDPVTYPAYPGAIQAAIDAARSPRPQSLVVVYPGTPAQWQSRGLVLENLVIYCAGQAAGRRSRRRLR